MPPLTNHEPKPARDQRPDRDQRKEAILDVARELFLTQGYANTSMSAIAQRLGGSKGTLYNYFKSKEDLFEAYIRRHCEHYRREICGLLDESLPLQDVLTAFGERYLSLVTSNEAMQTHCLVIEVSKRQPHIGKVFYESGVKSGAAILEAFLQKAHDRGELELNNPLLAAHQFVALCQNRIYKELLVNYCPAPTKLKIKAEVRAAIVVFYKAFAKKLP